LQIDVDLVLGLGGSDHDFSAAIVEWGEIKVAIEDERLHRVKRGSVDWDAQPARDAAHYCLEAEDVRLDQLAGIFCCDDLERPTSWLDWSQVTFVNHHAAHAASSYFTSPHRRAALLVIDGHGSPLAEDGDHLQVETISVGWAEENSLTIAPLQTGKQRRSSNSWRHVCENSIGWFYSIVTQALGFERTGQGKAMGLAAYGTPELLTPLREFVDISRDGRFRFDAYGGISRWLKGQLENPKSMQVRADIAYAAQEIFVEAIVAAAAEAHRQAPSETLCFAGGCALNTLANSRILAETPFSEVSVFPAAGDNGLSVGAAMYGAHCVLGQPRSEPAANWRARRVYTGRSYGSEEIAAVLRPAPVASSSPPDLATAAAEVLVAGETLAVCRGGSEIGPRALGNRSLLALPSPASMRDHVNLRVKERESFRPLAPVVPIEHVNTYFEGVEESPFMLLVAKVRAEMRDLLPATTHIDGTARVQTVRAEDNPFLYRLLELTGEATGVPVLLNTSLNFPGKPIVETPADALELFTRRPIDAMVLGDQIVRKYSPWIDPAILVGAHPQQAA
jgi:carbamoyltransferase